MANNLPDSPIFHGALDALLFGTYPKISGALKSATLGGDYEKNRDEEQERIRKILEANPGQAIAGSVLGGLLLPGVRGANTLAKTAGVAAGYGGLHGLGSSNAGPAGQIGLENLQDAASGAGKGAALGAGLYGAGQAIKPVVAPAAAKAQDIFQKVFGKQIDKLNPQAKYAADLSKEFKTDIRLGQASQHGLQQAEEDLLRSGAYGANAANKIQLSDINQQKQFQNAAQGARNNLAPELKYTGKGAGVKPGIEKIVGEAKAGKEKIREAYKAAEDEVSFVNPKAAKNIIPTISTELKKATAFPQNAPTAYSQLKVFDNILKSQDKKGLDVKQLEAYRQGLNKAISTAKSKNDGNDAHGLLVVKNTFDKAYDDLIENALIKGNSKILDQFKEGRAFNTEWHNQYSADHATEFGKKFIADVVDNATNSSEKYTNRIITDKIFGAQKAGFSKEADAIVNELRNQLGPNSPEFQGVQLEAANRILKPLLNQKGEANFGAPAVQSFKNNLYENKEFLENVLGKEKFDELSRLGDLGTFLYQSRKSVVNPSGSGVIKQALEQADTILSKFPGVKYAYGPLKEVTKEVQGNLKANRALDQGNLGKNLSKLNKAASPTGSGAARLAIGINSISDALKERKAAEAGPVDEVTGLSLSQLQEMREKKLNQRDDVTGLTLRELQELRQQKQQMLEQQNSVVNPQN